MNKLNNQTSARFYGNTDLDQTNSRALANDLSKEERQHWKKQRLARKKLIEIGVLLFELSFVGTCAYFILRSLL